MEYGVIITVSSLPIAAAMDIEYVILPEYTNAHIDAEITGRTDPWARSMNALRSVPEAWRQSVWAAAYLVCTQAKNLSGMNDALLREVELFHGGQRPERIETARR